MGLYLEYLKLYFTVQNIIYCNIVVTIKSYFFSCEYFERP